MDPNMLGIIFWVFFLVTGALANFYIWYRGLKLVGSEIWPTLALTFVAHPAPAKQPEPTVEAAPKARSAAAGGGMLMSD